MMNSNLYRANPFARALVDYHQGESSAEFVIQRDDGFSEQVPVSVFFDDGGLPILEQEALKTCHGHVLDVGAAAGRHTLKLLQDGHRVTSLDIVPEVEAILRGRGAEAVVIADVMEYTGERFDTLLMLMNGIGMVGSLERLDQFLQHAHELVSPSGQIICDSIDVSVTTNPVHVVYSGKNEAAGKPPGQQIFVITYKGVTGEPFHWLHISFADLSSHAEKRGWHAELLYSKENGHYLCRLKAMPDLNL